MEVPNILCRDCYGILIYPYDKISYDFKTNAMYVNLSNSPKRTNYERYFADLGTYDEVIEAFVGIRCDICDDQCPFFDWPEKLDDEFNDYDYDCEQFVLWLSREATV